jgi:hypothetical protein
LTVFGVLYEYPPSVVGDGHAVTLTSGIAGHAEVKIHLAFPFISSIDCLSFSAHDLR